MPGGGHSAALPVPCPLCVDVPPVTECGSSLLPCSKVHCQWRKRELALPHLVHGHRLAVSSTGSCCHSVTELCHLRNGGLWCGWTVLDAPDISHHC